MDMGTSNTRVWLCAENGVVASAKATVGAGTTKSHGQDYLFDEVKHLIATLLCENKVEESAVECILISGMGGSELGLCEVPHTAAPANVGTLAASVYTQCIPTITSIPFWFVPGVKTMRGNTLQDMMRGEEVETVGILAAYPQANDAVLLLPGTHNKVITVSAGTITDFYTTMSGELLNTVIEHTILSGQVTHDFTLYEGALLRGSDYARQKGLNAALFRLRVMAKDGAEADVLSSFLYGCVLGQDVDAVLATAGGKPIFVGGQSRLKRAYCLLLGENAVALPDDVCACAVSDGLQRIHRLLAAEKLRDTVIQCVEKEKLIAIIRHPDDDTLIPAVQALYDGGVRLVEVTFDRSGRVPKEKTAAQIRRIKEELPIFVGAGTVTSEEEVELAYEAGASYIISPNCDPSVIRKTRELGMVSMPAAFTPTEIALAVDTGADFVKLFPADALPKGYIKAVTAPLSDAKLLAVGGVTAANAAALVHDGFCGVGVGSNLYNKELIAKNDWQGLATLAKAYVDSLK